MIKVEKDEDSLEPFPVGMRSSSQRVSDESLRSQRSRVSASYHIRVKQLMKLNTRFLCEYCSRVYVDTGDGISEKEMVMRTSIGSSILRVLPRRLWRSRSSLTDPASAGIRAGGGGGFQAAAAFTVAALAAAAFTVAALAA